MSTDRVLVMADIAEHFEETVKDIIKETLSHREPPNIISTASKQRLAGIVSEATSHGARIIDGDTSKNNTDGNQFAQIVIGNITPSMKFWQEESFGPILGIRTVQSEQEAIEAANDTTYGLSTSIFTKDLRKALAMAKKLESG